MSPCQPPRNESVVFVRPFHPPTVRAAWLTGCFPVLLPMVFCSCQACQPCFAAAARSRSVPGPVVWLQSTSQWSQHWLITIFQWFVDKKNFYLKNKCFHPKNSPKNLSMHKRYNFFFSKYFMNFFGIWPKMTCKIRISLKNPTPAKKVSKHFSKCSNLIRNIQKNLNGIFFQNISWNSFDIWPKMTLKKKFPIKEISKNVFKML